MTLAFPIARVCLAYAAGKVTFDRAKNALRPYQTEPGQAEAWLASAKQPPAPGYGSWRHSRAEEAAA